jgi:hypothetical protein
VLGFGETETSPVISTLHKQSTQHSQARAEALVYPYRVHDGIKASLQMESADLQWVFVVLFLLSASYPLAFLNFINQTKFLWRLSVDPENQ